MVKVAVLDGDEEVPGLLAVSYYDQKPVHFLSMICEKIKRVECEKKVYCVKTEQVEVLKFLWLSINNEYNYGMGGVDMRISCTTTTALTTGCGRESGGGLSSFGELEYCWLIVTSPTRHSSSQKSSNQSATMNSARLLLWL